MPPEMIQRKPHGLAADIWSFGICCMEMANGDPPNVHSSFHAMFIAASKGYPEPFIKREKWSNEFFEFMSHCLSFNPSERWTVKQLLQHQFVLKDIPPQSEMMEIFRNIINNTNSNEDDYNFL